MIKRRDVAETVGVMIFVYAMLVVGMLLCYRNVCSHHIPSNDVGDTSNGL